MPKYAALIYGEESDPSTPPDPEVWGQIMSDYMEFGQNAEKVLAGGEALHPSTTATTVHVEGGKGGNAVYTDGPFAETKEVLGGFYLIDATDLDEALKWAQQIPGAWHGRVEVRPVMEFDENGNVVG
ncbi:MAG: YciI family protein [Actinomycetota bacterium]|nr:YciI family protein [Actinomycetota bacterium]